MRVNDAAIDALTWIDPVLMSTNRSAPAMLMKMSRSAMLTLLCGTGLLAAQALQAADAPSAKATPSAKAARVTPPRAASSRKPQVNGALLEFQIPEKVVAVDASKGSVNQRTVAGATNTSSMTQENTGDCVKNAGDGCKPQPKSSPKQGGGDGRGGRRRDGEGGGAGNGQGGAPAPGSSGDCLARNMTQENTGCE